VRIRRPWLLPLVPVWGAFAAVKNAMYDAGLLPVRRLDRPVISVGSLSAGGAGKTPVVLMLARLLQAGGITADVLSRGYGRSSAVAEEVDPAGTVSRFGDEPLEIVRSGLRVFVGAERFDAGHVAEGVSSAEVHLLDDGFQHRRLGRCLNVVLLTRADVEDVLIPAGNLRENVSSLRRADVVVVREEEAMACKDYFTGEVWVIRRQLVLPAIRPLRPLAFCAIARPEGFFAMLQRAGCGLAGQVEFADHYLYSDRDFAKLVEAASRTGADGFVTTAKDFVKISDGARRRLEAVGPVCVAKLRVELLDPARAFRRMQRVISRE